MLVRDHGALLESTTSLVLVVDMQEAFRSGIRGFAAILPRAVQIVNAARVLGVPVIGSEQSPHRMGPTIPELADHADRHRFYAKESFSAMQVRDIAESIGQVRPRSVVLLGCETHVAVLQTALQLMATFDGDVHLVVDATTSRRDRDCELALGRLQRTGVHLTSAEMVLFEWLRDTRHPAFAQVASAPQSSVGADSVSF